MRELAAEREGGFGPGFTLVANRLVPLAIALAAPVALAIAWVMLRLNGGTVGTVVGVLILVFMAILTWARIGAFLPMFAFDDPRSRRAGGPPHLPRRRPKVHADAIVL